MRIVPDSLRVLLFGTLVLLTACNSEKMQETERGMQQNYFLQSLRLIEGGGQTLQRVGVQQSEIDAALQQIDQGMAQAFQVDPDFLQQLDSRLPEVYREWFITGVEKYRLGVESSNRENQLAGLQLLSRWGEFWGEEGASILAKLEAVNE